MSGEGGYSPEAELSQSELETPKSFEEVDQIIKNNAVTLLSNDTDGHALSFLTDQLKRPTPPDFSTLVIGDLLESQVNEFLKTGNFKVDAKTDESTYAYYSGLKDLMEKYKAKGVKLVGAYPTPASRGDILRNRTTKSPGLYDPTNPESRRNFVAEKIARNYKQGDKVVGLITGMSLDEKTSIPSLLKEMLPDNQVQAVKVGSNTPAAMAA